MQELQAFFSQSLGRVEGQIGLVVASNAEVKQGVQAVHRRLDEMDKRINVVERDLEIFRRDRRWVIICGMIVFGIAATGGPSVFEGVMRLLHKVM